MGSCQSNNGGNTEATGLLASLERGLRSLVSACKRGIEWVKLQLLCAYHKVMKWLNQLRLAALSVYNRLMEFLGSLFHSPPPSKGVHLQIYSAPDSKQVHLDMEYLLGLLMRFISGLPPVPELKSSIINRVLPLCMQLFYELADLLPLLVKYLRGFFGGGN